MLTCENNAPFDGLTIGDNQNVIFFWTDASLLHQQRSRPFLWVSTLGVKQSRCENQSKNTPKPPQNTTTKTRSNPQNQGTKRLCVPRAQYSRSSQKSRCNRAAQSMRGGRKMRDLPDHHNHHHEATGATKVSTESCKSKKDSKVTDRHGQVPGRQSRKGKVQIGQLSQRRSKASTRPMVGQWNLLARTTDARPAQGTS